MNTKAQLIECPTGFSIRGELTFESVPVLWSNIQKIFLARARVEVDLKEVTYSNSAGLALLTACVRCAHHLNVPVIFKNLPKQLKQMACVTGIESMLEE